MSSRSKTHANDAKSTQCATGRSASVLAFLLPLILAAAFLNMGQTSCGDTGGTGGSGTGGAGGTGGGAGAPGETVTYFDVDLLGSPIAATDSNGDIVWRAGYEPFGHRLDETVGPDNALWYTGASQEPVSLLIDLGARHYNPEIGRFYGMDPVDFRENDPHSFNRYAYGNNSPYRYVDPNGDIPVETVWDIANIAIGVGSFVKNVSIGNYAGAAVDAVGVVVDTGAAVLPYVPGGVGSAIRAKRAADAVGAVVTTANRADTVVDASKGVTKVNGRFPLNSKWAGKTHPSGVKFNKQGFPDFAPFAKAQVQIKRLTGHYAKDAALANKAVGLKATPKGMVWHHVEDGFTMQLVPQSIHQAARHTGGAAVIRGR